MQENVSSITISISICTVPSVSDRSPLPFPSLLLECFGMKYVTSIGISKEYMTIDVTYFKQVREYVLIII